MRGGKVMREEDKIIRTMKRVCEKLSKDEYLEILYKIYRHIAEHENQNDEDRARSIKVIIDEEGEGNNK